MDRLEVENKRKSKDNSVNNLLKRLSLNANVNHNESDILNQSIPDHFEMMKHQDSINEKRPSSKVESTMKTVEEQPDESQYDTNNILDDESLK